MYFSKKKLVFKHIIDHINQGVEFFGKCEPWVQK